MNADDRPTTGDAPTPFAPTSGDAPVRRAALMPPSGSVPQRTAFRPVTGTQQTAGQTARTQRPAGQTPSAAPAGHAPAPAAQAPAPAQRPTSFSPVGAGAPAPQARGPFAPTTTPGTPAGAPAGFPGTAPAAAPGVGAPASATTAAPAARSVTAAAGIGRLKGAAADKVAKSDAKQPLPGAPRKVRVLLSRVDPFSALKIGFLLGIASGIMLLVAMHILWSVLDSMETFTTIQDWVVTLFSDEKQIDILQFFEWDKVMSATLLVAVTNVVLISGLSVVGAFLYNIVSRVVGGVYVTLTDD